MKYLLDTNALIYYIMGDETLTAKARESIENNECYYSYVSLWEIAIKQKLNKLNVPYLIAEIDDFCRMERFIHLPVTPEQIEGTKDLPLIHRDPFDRILISQALNSKLAMITSDTIIPLYDVKTVW